MLFSCYVRLIFILFFMLLSYSLQNENKMKILNPKERKNTHKISNARQRVKPLE